MPGGGARADCHREATQKITDDENNRNQLLKIYRND